jgi:2,4-dienoyl-CoA reductase (NADPH2)
MGTECYTVEKAQRRKKVVVIGGGPGGMEAARVAALRGHDVTLFEKSSKLGGLVPLAALIKGHEPEDLPPMVRYFKTQLKKLGVKTRLNTTADPSTVEKIKPDAVVVATGGTLTVPPISGISARKVVTTPALHARVKPFMRLLEPNTLEWLTKVWLPMGRRVVVIGGELHGCEVAEFLVKRGREVTIVSLEGEILGKGVLDLRLGLLLDWFNKRGVTLITGATDVAITDEGVVITKDGGKETIAANTVVPTSPLKPDDRLFKNLIGKVSEVYVVGDCREPRMIVDAIKDGWETGQKI